jgi:hypothetical protein
MGIAIVQVKYLTGFERFIAQPGKPNGNEAFRGEANLQEALLAARFDYRVRRDD